VSICTSVLSFVNDSAPATDQATIRVAMFAVTSSCDASINAPPSTSAVAVTRTVLTVIDAPKATLTPVCPGFRLSFSSVLQASAPAPPETFRPLPELIESPPATTGS
jgi:hypothetical protein